MNTPAIEPPIRELVGAAAQWRLLGLFFERPAGDWKGHLTSVAQEIPADDLGVAAAAAARDGTEGLYHDIFGPSGFVSPREVTYRQSMSPGQFISQLSSLYDAFAYQPSLLEAPDHLAVELGFVGYLRLKQAYALMRGATEQAQITSDVAERFIQDHLCPTATPITRVLMNKGPEYLKLAAACLQQRLQKYAVESTLDPSPSPGTHDTTAPFACSCE